MQSYMQRGEAIFLQSQSEPRIIRAAHEAVTPEQVLQSNLFPKWIHRFHRPIFFGIDTENRLLRARL